MQQGIATEQNDFSGTILASNSWASNSLDVTSTTEGLCMPTLTQLQSNAANSSPYQVTNQSEELIADSRASLTPSQLVDRKLAERTFMDRSRTGTSRPRAK